MDSPKSDEADTRFSTPVSDLDDHRNQSVTRPRGETLGSPNPHIQIDVERQPSIRTNPGSPHPKLLQVSPIPAVSGTGSISRDFEQITLDDNQSGKDEHVGEDKTSPKIILPRRSTLRRSPHNVNRSRDSSTSTRLSDTDNSVNAFAEPRRRDRANTVCSRATSEADVRLERTISAATHSRRPPFSNASVRAVSHHEDCASDDSPAEDDVCFPVPDEVEERHTIDFDELEEFVAEHNRRKGSVMPGHTRKTSFSTHINKAPIYNDLRDQIIPKITTESAGTLKTGLDSNPEDSDGVLDEKHHATIAFSSSKEKVHGAPDPSRYSFFSSELEETVHAVDFVDLLAPDETFQDLFQLPEDSGVWWLDVLNPTEDELHVFQRAFGVHRLTTEDIMTQEAREKVELFKQYYFVCFRSFSRHEDASEDYMEPLNVYMVVFREGIITITYTQSPHAGNVRQRIGKLRDYMALTADWICYALIDNIVDSFAPPIHDIEHEADAIEDQIFVARSEDLDQLLRQIGTCRKKVTVLARLLGGKADVIKGFAKRCNESYHVTPRGEIGLYLGDIQDHVVTMMSNLGHFEKVLSRSHGNYLAQLSVDQIRQGNRANEVLSKITLLASILVPLNLICGLFGMNVDVPGKNVDGLEWFFGIIGVIAIFVVLSLLAARRMRFI